MLFVRTRQIVHVQNRPRRSQLSPQLLMGGVKSKEKRYNDRAHVRRQDTAINGIDNKSVNDIIGTAIHLIVWDYAEREMGTHSSYSVRLVSKSVHRAIAMRTSDKMAAIANGNAAEYWRKTEDVMNIRSRTA
jgi:hypothetical protein